MKKFTQLLLVIAIYITFIGTAAAFTTGPPPPPGGIPVGGELFFKGSAILAVLMVGVWAIFRGKD